MLASQMCTSVSITRSSGIAGSSAVNVAVITRSFSMFSATAKTSAGTVSGAAPRRCSALIAVWCRRSTLHEHRPQLPDLRVGGFRRGAGHGDCRTRSRRLEKRLDTGSPDRCGIAGQFAAVLLEGGVCLAVHLVEQRQ